MQNKLTDLLKVLNINKKIDLNLLYQALTHKSAIEQQNKFCNERLEYLGDAVLKLAISDWLYNNYPDLNEGEMTKIHGYVLSDSNLANIAYSINLDKYLILGKSEINQKNNSIVASAFEAVIGAIYLCTSFEYIKNIVINLMEPLLKDIISGKINLQNYKASLQELVQSTYKCIPVYKTILKIGKPHLPIFISIVKIKSQVIGIGYGNSKKQSEQEAAKVALMVL